MEEFFVSIFKMFQSAIHWIKKAWEPKFCPENLQNVEN